MKARGESVRLLGAIGQAASAMIETQSRIADTKYFQESEMLATEEVSQRLLDTALIRIRLHRNQSSAGSLPGVFAALMRDEIESFPALRPHQRHAWHAFLVQVGALALNAAGRAEPPDDEAEWTVLLRGLTPDFPDDEPWSLVTPPARPALLQPPVPSGKLAELKTIVSTPDELDILLTSKNHDLKNGVMIDVLPDDWIFSLVTLQTMEQYSGRTWYGISRMNGGSSTRPAVGVVPPGGPGAHVRRDIGRLLTLRDGIAERGGCAHSGGLTLLWLGPWDGAISLKPSELDPLYVEVCRRVRLTADGSRIGARAAGSQTERVQPPIGGVTGDPWAPLRVEKNGGLKVASVPSNGFDYRRMVDLIFQNADFKSSPLQEITVDDAREGLTILARGLSRGNCVTEGYHERSVRVTARVSKGFLRTGDADVFAGAARDRVAIAGALRSCLRLGLCILFDNGLKPGEALGKYRASKAATARAAAFLARFEQHVDATFFPDLWKEFDEGADRPAVLRTWMSALRDHCVSLLEAADAGASKAVSRRYRARANGLSVFHGAIAKSPVVGPHFAGGVP